MVRFFRRGLNDELWEELEETLIAADTGVETTLKVLDGLRERVKSEGIRDPELAQEALKGELLAALEVDSSARGQLWGAGAGWAQQAAPLQAGVAKPAIILVVGVNGTGKTTSIGKLAHAYKQAGQKVLLAAADPFRAP